MDDRVKRLAVMIATSSVVADSSMAMLLEDDRLPLQLDEVTANLKEEHVYAANPPMSIFEVLGKAIDVKATVLRHECVAAALAQAGYIANRLRAARQPPWSLLSGDRAENLQVLRDGPLPTEESTMNIYQLMRLGYSRSTLLEGLALLAQANWSTNCVEQGHAHASALIENTRVFAKHITGTCDVFANAGAYPGQRRGGKGAGIVSSIGASATEEAQLHYGAAGLGHGAQRDGGENAKAGSAVGQASQQNHHKGPHRQVGCLELPREGCTRAQGGRGARASTQGVAGEHRRGEGENGSSTASDGRAVGFDSAHAHEFGQVVRSAAKGV